jgi:ADP-heptose:LPS heptosyltransferase
MHITPSHLLRTLPIDRWNSIIKALTVRLPDTTFVFTGSKNDVLFIEKALQDIDSTRYVIAAGKTDARELMTLYAHARVNVTVQTGNALMIAMLHLPQVVVNIKGTAMFYYDFNERATILYSTKDCICDPFETQCNMVHYKGEEYMVCVFNIDSDAILDAIVAKYNADSE